MGKTEKMDPRSSRGGHDQVWNDRHESGMTDAKKPKVGRLFDETAGYFWRTLVKIAILERMGCSYFRFRS